MANTKSAKKRIRQAPGRRERNRSQLSACRTAVKKLRKAIDSKDLEQVQILLPQVSRILDRTVGKDLIHKNAAARTKSRLVRSARKVTGQAS